MHDIRYFRTQFAYNLWANLEVLESVRTLDAPADESIRLLGHIVAAEQLWLYRIRAQSGGMPVWPDLNASEIEDHARSLNEEYLAHLADTPSEELTRPVAYTNSKGEPWANRVEEIFQHVLLHGSYHRGQVSQLVRKSDGEPILTDFIHCIRQGFIDTGRDD